MQVDVLSQELWSMENDKEAQVKGLEAELHDVKQRLQGYENIEKELDDIVMQSAQSKGSRGDRAVLVKVNFFLQWNILVMQRKSYSHMGLVPPSPHNPSGDYSKGELV